MIRLCEGSDRVVVHNKRRAIMPAGFLLSRVLLRFEPTSEDLLGDLSAVALTPDGSLWVGSDEFTTLERLVPVAPYVYGDHRTYALDEFVSLANQEDEIDIEGLDYAEGYLWLTGSHSTKRKKVKGKKTAKDIERIETIKREDNRYLLARIPILGGELLKSYADPEQPDHNRHAASLQQAGAGNLLTEALADDNHLGPFLSFPLPSKENGFDIEGLAVRGDRVFLGLRGPVLRGWAIIVEIAVEESDAGVLTLKPIGPSDALYKKHFVDLNGLGVREICFLGEDLIILAGPTMALEGAMRVFRLQGILEQPSNSLSSQDSDDLEVLFDLPLTIGSDHAEGLTLFPCLDHNPALMVVYDDPNAARRSDAHSVYADIFRLPLSDATAM
jgi:hypothetical protein